MYYFVKHVCTQMFYELSSSLSKYDVIGKKDVKKFCLKKA